MQCQLPPVAHEFRQLVAVDNYVQQGQGNAAAQLAGQATELKNVVSLLLIILSHT